MLCTVSMKTCPFGQRLARLGGLVETTQNATEYCQYWRGIGASWSRLFPLTTGVFLFAGKNTGVRAIQKNGKRAK